MIEFANEGEMLTVGKLLKNERERQELTLEDISERTKINVKYLKAIEEERKDQFPGELYADLFTKSYAEALGLEYAKIKAGTFASQEAGKKTEKKKKKDTTEAAPSRKFIGKREKKQAKEPAKPASSVGMSSPYASATTNQSSDSDAGKLAGNGDEEKPKTDFTKYLIAVAAVIICLFIVVVYISISSREPSDQRNEHGAVQSSEPTLEEQLADIDLAHEEDPTSMNGTKLSPGGERIETQGDSFVEGPISIYPESLEVVLVSSEESWASVVADGDTIFTSFFRPNRENSFRALSELEFSLGRWEFISGSIYGHTLKPLRQFHIPGNNAVRLHITKENWESFIDSSKARDEQD